MQKTKNISRYSEYTSKFFEVLSHWTDRKTKRFIIICICLFIPLAAGYLSAFFSMGTRDFYENLEKPFFSPPSWVFGPAWTFLYMSMGYASFLILEKWPQDNRAQFALTLYVFQLFLNFLWSIIFFGYGMLGAAAGEMLLLLILIVITAKKFLSIDRFAGLIMVPYLCWVSFAFTLNVTIWLMN